MGSPMMGGGGLLPGSNAGFLDLDRHHHHHHHHHHSQPHPQLHQIAASTLDSDHPMPLFDPGHLASSAAAARAKGILSSASTASDDDDPLAPAAGDTGPDPTSAADARARKGSPWHRMKWTDDVVRLLISVVAQVGDDGVGPDDPARRRLHPGASLQKKGKWKAVSKLMLERGCCVSPQQCEDKFNDLNKRYKRLNDILGRGTSCQVVENPALLDSMPHIPPKAKEDVRKILSSKHLFYREMCAYHNGQRIPNSQDIVGLPPPSAGPRVDDEEEEDEDEDDDGEEDGESGEEEDEEEERRSEEPRRHGALERLRAEMDGVLRDPARSPQERREWFRQRALRLQEERVEVEAEGVELARRLFKWHRFRGNKDRELETLRVENERARLVNERMLMQVRRQELELELALAAKGAVDPIEQGGDQMEQGG